MKKYVCGVAKCKELVTYVDEGAGAGEKVWNVDELISPKASLHIYVLHLEARALLQIDFLLG